VSQSRIYEVTVTKAPMLPFESVDGALQKSLVDAAIQHGMTSTEYALARNRLVEALSVASPVPPNGRAA
jgi:hypothetical protein